MKKWLKEEHGSFSLEASLVFPAFLIFTLIGVFFCIIIFQMGSASFNAHRASTHLAYVWDNSTKDITTGEFDKTQLTGLPDSDDGLYWRTSEFDFLSIIGLNDFGSGGNISDKLYKVDDLDSNVILDAEYKSNILDGEVKVTASSPLYIPTFMKNVIGEEIEVTSTHTVTESPELIRTHNFTKYLWKQFGFDKELSKAKKSIKKFFGAG